MGPLGKYSQQVAALTAVGVIGAAVAARFTVGADPFLDNLALIAMGAVFGAAASSAVNGHTITAAHRRLDLLSAPPSAVLEDQPELTKPAH